MGGFEKRKYTPFVLQWKAYFKEVKSVLNHLQKVFRQGKLTQGGVVFDKDRTFA